MRTQYTRRKMFIVFFIRNQAGEVFFFFIDLQYCGLRILQNAYYDYLDGAKRKHADRASVLFPARIVFFESKTISVIKRVYITKILINFVSATVLPIHGS